MRQDIIDYIVKECNKNDKQVDTEVLDLIKKYFDDIAERSSLLSM